MGSGRGGRGGGRRAEVGTGRGEGRVPGTTGILSCALGLLADLITARRARQSTDVRNVRSVGSLKTGSSPTPGRALPVDSKSRGREASPSSFAYVIVEKCVGCGICAQACPVGAIIVDEVAAVDARRCTGCGQCVAECPKEALVLKKA